MDLVAIETINMSEGFQLGVSTAENAINFRPQSVFLLAVGESCF